MKITFEGGNYTFELIELVKYVINDLEHLSGENGKDMWLKHADLFLTFEDRDTQVRTMGKEIIIDRDWLEHYRQLNRKVSTYNPVD